MLALLVAIEVAGWSAGAVRTPSSPSAWGGVREKPEAVANYDIEAGLDPREHTIDGHERLTWRNRSAETDVWPQAKAPTATAQES